VVLCFLGFTNNLFSQTKALNRPVAFDKITNENRLSYDADGDLSGKYWIAYSSFDNNPTYMKADGREVKKYLGFLDKVYITEIDGKYAHIYKDSNLNLLSWELSNDATDMGWISMKELMLTDHCLVEEQSLIANKCMILNTFNALKKGNSDQSDFVSFYLDPELKNATGDQSKIFQIFYVFKTYRKSGEVVSLLVGTSNRLSDPESRDELKNTIKGWVPFDRVVEWNHRVAVEPNYESDAAEERKSKGIKTSVFDSYEKSVDFQQGKEVNPRFLIWSSDTYMDRKNGEWIRFPLVNKDGDMFRLGVMGSLDNVDGEELYSTEENAELRAKTAETALKLRKINILFVVDGTSSMGKYFQSSIVPAIRETINTLVERQSLNNFQFGALIYRDADEKDRLIQTIPLTTNYDEVINRLKKVEAKDIFDLSKGEALYQGLYDGFRGVLNSNDETNVVILIGDAGNREDNRTHVEETDLINYIYKRDANLICFQVYNDGSDPTYGDFKTQTMRIIEDVSKKHAQDSKDIIKAAGQDKNYKVTYIENGKNSYIWDGSRYFEAIYADKGETKDVSELKKAIVRAIEKRNDRTNEIITMRNMVLEEGASIETATLKVSESSGDDGYDQTDALGAGFLKLMKDAGLTDDQIQKAIQDKVQIYNEGYSPYTVQNLNNPLYTKVLLYSANEFSDMYSLLTDLVEARNSTQARQKLYDVWVETLGRYLGEIDKAELEEMSLGDIQNMVFGLPGAEGLIKEKTLSEIRDEKELPEKELNAYLYQVKKKWSAFDKIANFKDYPYTFMTNNKKYYWISEDMIP